MHNILKYVRRTIIWGIIFQNEWKRCIIFHTDYIFTQEPELELLAQAQVSLTSHINIFFIFFLCVCEFNVYSRNSFELKLFFKNYRIFFLTFLFLFTM